MISTLKFNRQQMSDRKKVFDQDIRMIENSYGTFVDHTKMKGHEFADFQKSMFQQMKKDKKRGRIVLLITVIITLLLVIGFLLFWNNYDFNLLKSSEF